MAKDMQKQITLLAVLLVVGILLLGSFAPQVMDGLNDLGINLKIPFFKEPPSGAALGYVTLVVDPPATQNEQGTE